MNVIKNLVATVAGIAILAGGLALAMWMSTVAGEWLS